MSLRGYAARRGCSLSAVQKAIATRRISTIPDDRGRARIDPEVADIQWARNTDPLQSLRATGAPLGAPPESPATVPEAPSSREKGGGSEYSAAQAALTRANASIAELKLREMMGQLAPVSPMVRAVMTAHTAARNGVLALPDRLAATLAAETDPTRVYDLIQAECEQICRTMQHAAEKLLDGAAATMVTA